MKLNCYYACWEGLKFYRFALAARAKTYKKLTNILNIQDGPLRPLSLFFYRDNITDIKFDYIFSIANTPFNAIDSRCYIGCQILWQQPQHGREVFHLKSVGVLKIVEGFVPEAHEEQGARTSALIKWLLTIATPSTSVLKAIAWPLEINHVSTPRPWRTTKDSQLRLKWWVGCKYQYQHHLGWQMQRIVTGRQITSYLLAEFYEIGFFWPT